MEHLQSEEPFSSDPYFRVCTIFSLWKQGTFRKPFQTKPRWHQLKYLVFINWTTLFKNEWILVKMHQCALSNKEGSWPLAFYDCWQIARTSEVVVVVLASDGAKAKKSPCYTAQWGEVHSRGAFIFHMSQL